MPVRAIPAHPVVGDQFRAEMSECVELVLQSPTGPDLGTKDINGRIALGANSDWDPAEHDLEISVTMPRRRLAALFGPDGVAPRDAELALALNWMSQGSAQRESCDPQRIDLVRARLDEPMTFVKRFGGGTLRGSLVFEVEAVLSRAGQPQPDERHLANVPGTRVGAVTRTFYVTVDGSGSLFPIREVSAGPQGALWRFEGAWDDPLYDEFDVDNVALEVNLDHPEFEALRGTGAVPYQTSLFRQVVTSWIAAFLLELHEDLRGSEDWEAVLAGDHTKYQGGSIAEAAFMFISRGVLSTGSAGTLLESIQLWIERQLRGGE